MLRKISKEESKYDLSERTEFSVRFSEADPLGIAWHGSYVNYFEDGREAFGKKYGLTYLNVLENGYVTPFIKMNFEFRQALKYNEKAIVETRYTDSDAAKIIFHYSIFRASDMELMTTGETVQIFLSTDGELSLTMPEFFMEWKKRWGIIND